MSAATSVPPSAGLSNAQLAVESGDAVREPEETAPPGPGAPDTIVVHADPKCAVAHVDRDLSTPCGLIGAAAKR
jgi:hypothetical protein